MKKIVFLILVVFSLLAVRPIMAVGPMLKFVPSSGTYTNGETFKVTIAVDSGVEKSQAVDAWATFDSGKLEVVSIETAASPVFSFSLDKNFNNSTGKFNANCISSDMSNFTATTLVGDLVTVTFKAKATGTASVNFNCTAGSTVDTNIYNLSAADVIDCASNVNGVYTINAGGGGTTADPTATPVPSDGGSDTTTGSEELPQTGGIGTTLGLIVFGIVGVLSSLALRFL